MKKSTFIAMWFVGMYTQLHAQKKVAPDVVPYQVIVGQIDSLQDVACFPLAIKITEDTRFVSIKITGDYAKQIYPAVKFAKSDDFQLCMKDNCIQCIYLCTSRDRLGNTLPLIKHLLLWDASWLQQ